MRWVTEAELQRLLTTGNLRSPELLEYFALSKDLNKKDEMKCSGNDIVFAAPLVEINEQVWYSKTKTNLFTQRKKPKKFDQQLEIKAE